MIATAPSARRDGHPRGSARAGALLVLGLFLAGPATASAGGEERPPAISRYFSISELAAAHPAPERGVVYHGKSHTLHVSKMAFELAVARKRSVAEARFIREVALLHDWDSGRKAGTPARVLDTLGALDADFSGKQPLVAGAPERSILRERFGWSREQLLMAKAMIQRTEFPFGSAHPNPAYAGASPLARYEALVAQLPPAQQRFVLTEAPLLSEYADKGNNYFMRAHSGAARAVRALATEINTAAGKKITGPVELNTAAFMASIGTRKSFALDHALADKLGAGALSLPTRGIVLRRLPAAYRARYAANLAGFAAFQASARAGASLTKAYQAGSKAAR